MTREEAIKTLKITHCKGCNDYGDCETCYIGVAIADMEKQIPKKPIYSGFDENEIEEMIPYKAKCPVCGNSFEFGKWNVEENHHCECGQAISWLWSEEND